MVVQKGTTSLFKDSVESAKRIKLEKKKKVLGPESEALGNDARKWVDYFKTSSTNYCLFFVRNPKW